MTHRKNRWMGTRLRGALAAGLCTAGAATLTLLGAGTASAAAPSVVPVTPLTAIAQQMPAAGAPMSAWQSWSTAQRSVMTVANLTPSLSASAAAAGCTLDSVQVLPVTSAGTARVPAGILVDAIAFSAHCPGVAAATTGRDTVPKAALMGATSSCPMGSGTTRSIIDGVLCVGPWYLNGNYVAATYANTTSYYYPTGQVQLGGGGCPGTELGSNPPYSYGQISPGTWWGVMIYRNYCAEWSSTWIEDYQGSRGSACGNY